MKPTSFVPMVGEISAEDASEVPGLGAVISYWTGDRYSAEEWFRELNDLWGTAGFAVRRGGEVQGFVVYGPSERLAQAARYPLGPLDDEAVLLAYAGGDVRTRRRLLVRMLRDLRQRGVGTVEAIASDRGVSNHVPTSFLLESGWQPMRRAPYRMSYYTLAHIDLKSAVEVGELARALVGRVKLPGLKSPVPGTLARTAGQQRSR
ncbi:MAG TPA: hypothetical protein VFH16_17665 [Rubrobacter sp.]|nr:hypothetical protein [Rubrobacter sp.]